MPYHYVWFIWSTAFLVPWAALFMLLPRFRRRILWSSGITMPLGLTEPIFVPRYWDPPSLFDLAQRSGFDVESLIFAFAIGGTAAVLYESLTKNGIRQVGERERQAPHHRHHRLALYAPLIVFPLLYALPWNPIYAAIASLALAGCAVAACRPDLLCNILIGGVLFTGYYMVFLLLLEQSAPGYIAVVWNLRALSGVTFFGMPLEELLFAFSFGAYWSGLYEHLLWLGPVRDTRVVKHSRH